jgi:hypothetical protein
MSMISNIAEDTFINNYLDKLYNKDPKVLVKFMNKAVTRFTSRANTVDPEKIEKDCPEIAYLFHAQVLSAKTKIDLYLQFIDNLVSDVSIVEELYDAVIELETLQIQYNYFDVKYNNRISSSKHLSTSEVNGTFSPPNLRDNITIRKNRANYTSKGAPVKPMTGTRQCTLP